MFKWFKDEMNKAKSRAQQKIDEMAGFENAIQNPLYGGSEIVMADGEVLEMKAIDMLFLDTTTVSKTKGTSKERLLSIRDKRDSKSTTKRTTFSKNGRKYFVDQIVSVRPYSEEEQPKFIKKA